MSIAGLCDSNGELPDYHRIVSCNLEVKRTGGLKRETIFQSFRNINIVVFKKDIRETCLSQSTGDTADELIDTYNMSIKDIVDKHATEQVKVITLRPYAPWYNDHIREAKREKRLCERKYKKSNLERDRQNYIVKCKTIYKLLDYSKRAYYSSRINQYKTNKRVDGIQW